jgi:hypothetical protein
MFVKTVSVGFSVLYNRESSLELSYFTEEFSDILIAANCLHEQGSVPIFEPWT